MEKYKLTEETLKYNGVTLYRIEALKDFADVKKGDIGGWIERENNLSQHDNAWVYGNAKVFGDAKVGGTAWVFGNAGVSDNAEVYGDAKVSGNAEVSYNAKIKSTQDYIVFKNWWSSGRFFTWTRSNNMWYAGCFYGTGKELIAKAYKDSELSGKEYERVVNYVEGILKEYKDA